MKAKLAVAVLLLSGVAFAQLAHPALFIEQEQGGFDTYLAAAMSKKHVPIDLVSDPSQAAYILRAAPVETKTESTGSKVARCLFLYCAGIEDRATVSVQLVEQNTGKILWSYSVHKQRGAGGNSQSMAEAVAKHFKGFLEKSER
jgi:hypothetical protein